MKRKGWAFWAAICLMAGLLGGTAQGAEEKAAAFSTRDYGMPYYIMVDRVNHAVTVYGPDGDGYYTVPVREIICSVGKPGAETPLGTYAVGERYEWCYMVDGSYGQYATRIYKGIMFHSVCYNAMDPSTLKTYEYNDLGASVSLGCVRLQTGDAKWIYENCAPGTTVTIWDGESGGALPQRAVEYVDPGDPKAGWDPTDPREGNPWRVWMEENALPFSDVPFGAAGYDDIQYVYRRGLMGQGSERFGPNEPLMGDEALRIVRQLAGEETPRARLWNFPTLVYLSGPWEPPAAGEPVSGEELEELMRRYEALRTGKWPVGLTLPDGPITRAQAAGIFRSYDRLGKSA